MKDLVLCAFTHYCWKVVQNFFFSWKQHLPDSECVVFVEDVSDMSLYFLNQLGVKAIPIPEKYQGKSIYEYRFLLYEAYLMDTVDQYRQIFLCDLRDLVFQADVFSLYREERFLLCAQEFIRVGEDKSNSRWVTGWFGIEEFKRLRDELVLCSGTILGTAREILELIRQMNHIMFSGEYPFMEVSDQGPFNYIIRHGLVQPGSLFISDNHTGKILSVWQEDTFPRKDGNICNEAGVPAAVVHQYDRHESLIATVEAAIVPAILSIPEVEDIGSDLRSALDAASYLILRGDLAGALHLVMSVLFQNRGVQQFPNCSYADVAGFWSLWDSRLSPDDVLYYPLTALSMELFWRTERGHTKNADILILRNMFLEGLTAQEKLRPSAVLRQMDRGR